ncbi:MAG: hypothetical protein SNJ54_08460 [Anaerolineae bacterium]
MPTPYKIFLSVPDAPTSEAYLGAVRTALWRMDQMLIAAISPRDIIANGEDRILLAKQAMETSALFIGVYGPDYGALAPNSQQSYAEQEYRLAFQRGLLCAIFMHEDCRTHPDARMQHFRELLETRHVINYFKTLDELQAQVILAVDTHLRTSRQMRLLPPAAQGFGADGEVSALVMPAPDEPLRAFRSAADALPPNFETLVEEGLRFAADEIELIVRRALQVWDAQKQLPSQEAASGVMRVTPIFGVPQQQSQFRSDIFMVMPFREPYNAIYQTVIRPVASSLNLSIRRGDEFASVRGVVMKEVWAAINGCRLIIADISEVNANVFYELGIAHTVGKPAILLTQAQSPEEVPFDVRHLRYISYRNTIEGGEKLAQDLRQAIIWILNDLKEITPQ